MNVYDFDHTLYPGDASIDFWKWSVRRYPQLLIYLPMQGITLGLWLIGILSRTTFKAFFFSFLKGLPEPPQAVAAFWRSNPRGLFAWYCEACRENDVIISASPAFLIKACPWLPSTATVIATEMDITTGRISGKNCRGEEKVRRFDVLFPKAEIETFCSDSTSDAPLAKRAKSAFMISSVGERLPWRTEPASPFLSLQFLRFLFCGGLNVLTGILFAWLFSLLFQVNIAFVLGYYFSHLGAYLLNACLVFKSAPRFSGYLRFCIAYIPNFAIQFLIVLVVYNLLSLPKLLAYTLAALLGVPVTFLCLRLYAFRNPNR